MPAEEEAEEPKVPEAFRPFYPAPTPQPRATCDGLPAVLCWVAFHPLLHPGRWRLRLVAGNPVDLRNATGS